MDNREAVNWLINISADIGKVEHSDLWHYERALTEIKDMLESIQPVATDTNVGNNSEIPNSSDAISRQQAIDALDCINGTEEVLRSLPPAQPETAKRIVGKSRDGMTLWYQCDMCNEPVDAQDNYCRGCGRRLIDE